jgi:methionyl aminopeptidase
MQNAGRITRAVLDAMKQAVCPGITTLELNQVARGVLWRHSARSAPMLVYGFPGFTCISVNDEVVHGLPGHRELKPGDLLKLDVTVERSGYMADACETVCVAAAASAAERLANCARQAFTSALREVRIGAPAYDIDTAVQREVRRAGYSVVKDLTGNGIGRTIHEAPTIPNHRDPRCSTTLIDGLVFTIEPIIVAGGAQTRTSADGWTIRTRDRSLAHTMSTP